LAPASTVEAHELHQGGARRQGLGHGLVIRGLEAPGQVHLRNLAGKVGFQALLPGGPVAQLPLVILAILVTGTGQGLLGNLPP